MRLLEDDNGRKVLLEIDIETFRKKYLFEVTERIFSKMIVSNTVSFYKEIIHSKVFSDIFKELQATMISMVQSEFDREWTKLSETFTEALPEDIELAEDEKVRRVRCSRQMTMEELEEMRQKLLEKLGSIYE